MNALKQQSRARHPHPVSSDPAEILTPLAITMTSYGIRGTDPDGVPRTAGVSYDQASAKDRKTSLTAEKCRDIEIVPVKPGERLHPGY
ncbi:hypothetical protein [Streptomyces sp. NPDC005345]|uniref:hypothetical protein n=1 Tax=Streptomyces sp. NPDC005345 TaxID=3156877 RepID=UPI0033B14411